MSATDLGRAFMAGLLGLVFAPLAVFAILLVFYAVDPRCGTPGDGGGCEMQVASLTMMSPIPGAVLFFVVTLLKGLLAGRQRSGLAG